jgi:glycosyltransferase involved in cell wall biosynthesis
VLEAVGGGTLRHILDVLRTVHNVEHHVVIPPNVTVANHLASHVSGAPVQQIIDAGGIVHRLEMVRNPLHPQNAVGVFKLRRLISILKPAVIHGHSSVGGAFARAAAVGRSIPVVYTPNGLATNRAILLVERALTPFTDRFIAVSESEAARALALGVATRSQLVVINNGIDLEPKVGDIFDLRHFLDLPAATPIVGTVARLVAQKSPKDFVRVCAKVHQSRPEVHFVLVGSGELQSEVDAEVTRAGLGAQFHQIPFLENASLAIEQMDVFVLPSYFEGAPYTPLEAMRAGVPVVLTDVAGSADCVEPGVSGFRLPFGDVAGMAQGALALLDDHQLRRAMVDAARIRVKERFDVLDMGAQLERFYADLGAA